MLWNAFAFLSCRFWMRLFASDDTIIEKAEVWKYTEEFGFISYFFLFLPVKKDNGCEENVKYPI